MYSRLTIVSTRARISIQKSSIWQQYRPGHQQAINESSGVD